MVCRVVASVLRLIKIAKERAVVADSPSLRWVSLPLFVDCVGLRVCGFRTKNRHKHKHKVCVCVDEHKRSLWFPNAPNIIEKRVLMNRDHDKRIISCYSCSQASIARSPTYVAGSLTCVARCPTYVAGSPIYFTRSPTYVATYKF
jgi:hypothetical protein